ncbi:hypothetical protein ACFHW2_11515 [Actinomadura sp. LOL_016]|uniref:hypothetical protein n=1 Tax=unclassified Actinomadura TaxID=2626254 RepID=UPI003A800835
MSIDRWYLRDCEGELSIWRETALLGITRDDAGDITGYRLPARYRDTDLIATWDLSTWDRGQDADDDRRRDLYAEIVRAHNAGDEVKRLREEVEKLRLLESGGRKLWQHAAAERDTARGLLAEVQKQRDAVLDLIGREYGDAAADMAAGGPLGQLNDLTVPVHDLLVALGMVADTTGPAGKASKT